MSRLDELIRELCPDGVKYSSIGSIITRVREKAKDNPDICQVYAVSNTQGMVRAEDFRENTIHSEDTSNYTVVRQNMVAYNPSRLNIGSIARLKYSEAGLVSPMYVVFSIDESQMRYGYFDYLIKSSCVAAKIESLKEEGARFRFDFSRWDWISIPIPPLEIQDEIVRILDKFTTFSAELSAELSARQKQYSYYREKLLTFKTGVVWKTLGDIGKVSMCKRIMKNETTSTGDVPFYKIGTFGKEADAYISQELFEKYRALYSYPKKGDILISAAGTIGRTVVFDGSPAYFQDSNIVWVANDETQVLNRFLLYWYQTNPWKVATGGTIARLYNDNIANAKVPVLPLDIQQRIVDILDSFDAICSNLQSGLPAEIEARQKQYEYYRDKLLNFKEMSVQ